jgi:Uma2 family endonuclease
VNGEIRIVPPPVPVHGTTLDNLFFLIRPQVNPREVRVRLATFEIVIRTNPLTARIPDLANTRREREEELADYAAIGIPEVWVMSPEAQTVEVLYLEDGRYHRAILLGPGDTLKPKLFPHVQVDIAQIWPD